MCSMQNGIEILFDLIYVNCVRELIIIDKNKKSTKNDN